MIIDFSRPKPERPIRNFAKMLIESEGAGVLNWMIKGAIRHLAELASGGDFVLTEAQMERVDSLL